MKNLIHLLVLLVACSTARAQNAAPKDLNPVNNTRAPSDMMADSPVTFPEKGALPSRFPPDVKTLSFAAEKDYSIFESPCRSLDQVKAIQSQMPAGTFTVVRTDWKHLPRTRRILTEGGDLHKLADDLGCAYFDMTTPWIEYIRSSKQHPHVFYRDRVHANPFGEQILAKIMLAWWTP